MQSSFNLFTISISFSPSRSIFVCISIFVFVYFTEYKAVKEIKPFNKLRQTESKSSFNITSSINKYINKLIDTGLYKKNYLFAGGEMKTHIKIKII